MFSVKCTVLFSEWEKNLENKQTWTNANCYNVPRYFTCSRQSASLILAALDEGNTHCGKYESKIMEFMEKSTAHFSPPVATTKKYGFWILLRGRVNLTKFFSERRLFTLKEMKFYAWMESFTTFIDWKFGSI